MWSQSQVGAAQLRRFALPWADLGLPFQGEEVSGKRQGPPIFECTFETHSQSHSLAEWNTKWVK